jgi:hypothetical protein
MKPPAVACVIAALKPPGPPGARRSAGPPPLARPLTTAAVCMANREHRHHLLAQRFPARLVDRVNVSTSHGAPGPVQNRLSMWLTEPDTHTSRSSTVRSLRAQRRRGAQGKNAAMSLCRSEYRKGGVDS